MDRLTREVISRYIGDSDGDSYDHDKSWMEYLQDEYCGVGKVPTIMEDLLEGKEELNDPKFTYNPYDYKDPSTKPKELRDSPVFQNIISPSKDIGLFMVPFSLWKEHGELEEWGKATHLDPTEDEDTQYPALSATRKLAREVIARYSLDMCPLHVAPHGLDEILMMHRVAKSLREVVNDDHHYKQDAKVKRAKQCTVILESTSQEKYGGLFRYRVQSPGSTKPQTVFLQLLRDEAKAGPLSYVDYPMKMACTCESFLWYGAHFYATQQDYIFPGAFRRKVSPPKKQTEYTLHVSPYYPHGKHHPGRGLNFTVCKHILAVYDQLKGLKIERKYRNYPTPAQVPPSKIMNKEVWKKLMKFDFTEANIKQRLMGARPKIPDYFHKEMINNDVIEWFNDVWIPATEQEKIDTLKKMVESPERIFFVLLKEAALQRKWGKIISPRMVNEGYKLMAKVVQPENEMTPEQVDMPQVPEEEKIPGIGTGISAPGGTIPAAEFIEQAAQPVVSPLKKPKKTLEERQRELRERGLSPKEKEKLKRFEEEEVEPRKEKQRQLGKRPFYNE